MRIRELVGTGAVVADLKGRTKRAVIAELVDCLAQAGEELDPGAVLEALLEREKLGTTGIGNGIAIPHAKAESVKRMALAVGRSSSGIAYRSLDGRPVRLVFLLVAPRQEPGPHIKALACLARVLRDPEVQKRLLAAGTEKDLLCELVKADEKGG